jgi:HSP20 family protein
MVNLPKKFYGMGTLSTSSFGRNFMRSFYGLNEYPMDIIDREDEFLIRVAIPGATNVSVSVEDTVLLLDVDRDSSEEAEEGQFNIQGITDYAFSKTLSLSNTNIDVDKITSKYSKGILEVTLPKTEEAKPKIIPVDVVME